MVETSRIGKLREGQVKIKEIMGTKTRAWMESGRRTPSPSQGAR